VGVHRDRLVDPSRGSESVRAGFFDRGNQIQVLDDWSSLVGGGQGFPRDPATSADPRRDGDALTI
jgi:hypothetical protein